MRISLWPLLLSLCWIGHAGISLAQMPFYTDNPDVTDQGTLHFESFNEFDGLQSTQFPNLRQNTANFKLNYGLPHSLELDFDIPYLGIYRAPGTTASSGIGDADMGIKWNFRKAPQPLRWPALASSLYIEFPTGNSREELGSGLSDYALNVIAEEPFSGKTRLTANAGYLFAGNTTTGVVGVQTTRGHVVTGGLSLLHDFTPRVTLGAEVYGGFDDNAGLGKDQVQGLIGGEYDFREGLGVTFAVLGGAYEASPRIGGQVGFEVDFPHALRRHAADKSSH